MTAADKTARINAAFARLGIAAKVTAGAGYVLVLAKTGMDLDLALRLAKQTTAEHMPVYPARRGDDSYPYRARVWA